MLNANRLPATVSAHPFFKETLDLCMKEESANTSGLFEVFGLREAVVCQNEPDEQGWEEASLFSDYLDLVRELVEGGNSSQTKLLDLQLEITNLKTCLDRGYCLATLNVFGSSVADLFPKGGKLPPALANADRADLLTRLLAGEGLSGLPDVSLPPPEQLDDFLFFHFTPDDLLWSISVVSPCLWGQNSLVINTVLDRVLAISPAGVGWLDVDA